MRFVGRITDWHDAKGYGFVVPNGGGERAFAHIKEFRRGPKRPALGDLISYLPARDPQGRLTAKAIRHVGLEPKSQRAPSRLPRAALGAAALASAAVLAALGFMPALVTGVIFGTSALSYVAYWLDKSASQRGGQRTPESTLHGLGLLGGWPGALIAQQQFHHKTVKQPFQRVFWITVLVNVAVTVWLVQSGLATEFALSL
jgi:uncharacterized membrane protein YsdA (DUF1294 family)/cold shock CspA family protein